MRRPGTIVDWICCTALIIFAGSAASGQEAVGTGSQAQAPAAVLRLTLKEAVQLGLKQNPQRVIAALELAESRRTSQISRAALLPQADIAADAALRQYNRVTIEKTPLRGGVGPYQYVEAGPHFSQTVVSLPLIRGYQIGKEGVNEAAADEKTAREQAVGAVVGQYLLILRAIANRDAAASRVELAQRLFDQAKELERTGIGLSIDTVRANVELQNEKQTLIDAETQTKTTRYVLAQLLDLPKEREVEAADPLDFFNLPDMNRDEMVARALRLRPEVRALEAEQRIAALETKSSREQRLPELQFSGYWLYQGEHFNDGIPAYGYTLSMMFPLFTGGRIHAEVERAKLEEQRVAEARRQLEDRIVQEVKSSYDELTAARTAVDVANQGFELAQQEVAQAERRFKAGVTTNVEVITAQDALARASDNRIDALYRFNESRASLAQAMGEVENTYAK